MYWYLAVAEKAVRKDHRLAHSHTDRKDDPKGHKGVPRYGHRTLIVFFICIYKLHFKKIIQASASVMMAINSCSLTRVISE